MNEPRPTFVAAWLLAVAACLSGLGAYSWQPGQPSDVADELPSGVPVELGPRGALVIFVHPHCPCSLASLEEVARILRDSTDAPQIELFAFIPRSEEEGWVDGRIWRRAAELGEIRRRLDRAGDLARELGVTTSGHVIAYGPDGARRFDGGVTAGRGHLGPSAPGARLMQVLAGGEPAPEAFPVFGCGLAGPGASGE